MKRRQVVLSPEANEDLIAIYDRIANAASPEVAFSYLERIETFLMGFDLASERGTLRDEVRPGLRIVGFERRITVAFAVFEERVVILRLFQAGRRWEDDFEDG